MKKLNNGLLFISIILLSSTAYTQYGIVWNAAYGGSALDLLLTSTPTDDGGSAMAGYSYSGDGDVSLHYGTSSTTDFWIVKNDELGNLEWAKTYGGTKNDAAYAIQQTSDGGYIVAGESYSDDEDITGHYGSTDYPDFWVIKLNANGDLEWQKSYGGSHIDAARSVTQTADGGYIVAGFSWSTDGIVTGNHGASDMWLVKISSVGTLSWQKSFGGSSADAANSILQSDAGGYIVGGNTYSNDGDVTFHSGSTSFSDCWILRLYDDGEINWQRSFGGTDKDEIWKIKKAIDYGYIIVGDTYSSDGDVTVQHGSGDYWVFKIGEIGNLVWEKSLGGSFTDIGHDITANAALNGYAVIGASKSVTGDVTGHHGDEFSTDYWMALISIDGTFQNGYSFGGIGDDGGRSIIGLNSGGYLIAGNSNSTDPDFSVHDINGDFNCFRVEMSTSISNNTIPQLIIYPNPAVDNIFIEMDDVKLSTETELQIFDIQGKLVYKSRITSTQVNLEIKFTQGMYTVKVINNNGSFLKQLVIR